MKIVCKISILKTKSGSKGLFQSTDISILHILSVYVVINFIVVSDPPPDSRAIPSVLLLTGHTAVPGAAPLYYFDFAAATARQGADSTNYKASEPRTECRSRVAPVSSRAGRIYSEPPP